MTPAESTPLRAVDRIAHDLKRLSGETADAAGWPQRQFELLREAGVLRWGIPAEFGGITISSREMLVGYAALAHVCLTTAFILTQRNGACQRIAQSPNPAVRQRLLAPLARGEKFATVGISHLTTSRLHLGVPAVQAVPRDAGFELTGEIPWVTGALQAHVIVTGGVLSDGRQLLAAVSTNDPGVAVASPARLLALAGSQTSAVALHRVRLLEADIVQPPAESVMRQGPNVSTGSLSTSALALGHACGALDALDRHVAERAELAEFATPLRREAELLERDLLDLSGPEQCGPPGGSVESLRTRANSLVLRVTQVLLAASKGAGFVSGTYAERAVREALFFLVWSCPQPVVWANLRELVDGVRRTPT
ncbi:MAG: acyl-CoA dehydrogenase family protein [Planctomycetales bacterium]